MATKIKHSEVEIATVVNPTFSGAWADYGFPVWQRRGYFKDSVGVLHLQGLVTGGGAGGSNNVIFNLPLGHRPTNDCIFPVVNENGLGRVDIRTTGDVVFVSGVSGWVSLDGISFKIGAP